MNANNVITFPKEYHGPRVNGLSANDINDNVNMMKTYHIEETIYNLAPIIFNHLEISGFDLVNDDDEFAVKDGALILESIKSLLSKHYEIHHPFQNLAEAVFVEVEDGNGNTLKIVENLNIEMTEN